MTISTATLSRSVPGAAAAEHRLPIPGSLSVRRMNLMRVGYLVMAVVSRS